MDIQIKWFYRLGFLLLFFVVIFLFWKLRQLWLPIIQGMVKILTPFLIAAFITYLLNPLVERIHARGLHRGVAVFIIYALFFGSIGFALYKGIPTFIDELKDFSENAPLFSEQYRLWLDNIQRETSSWPDGVQERVNDGIGMVEVAVDRFVTKVMTGLLNLANAAVIIALIPFIAFYMIKDYDALRKALWYMTPRKWRKKGIQFLREVDQSLGAYIRGQLFVCFLIGIVSAILFWMIGMKYALLLGIIIGITNVIPYFGPLIGAFPAVMIAATTSIKMVVMTIVIVLVLQFIEGNLLGPVIVGKTLQMHPLVIMFGLLIGGEIGGIIGLILIVPVFAIMKIAIIQVRDHFIMAKKVSYEDND